MNSHPLMEELLAPVLRVAMPRAVGRPAVLRPNMPPWGTRRNVPVPSQIHASADRKVLSGTLSAEPKP